MPLSNSRMWAVALALMFKMSLGLTSAHASVVPISIGAFGPGSTLTTFTGLADLTEVNGLTVDGILFTYSLGNDRLWIDTGPGVTNNVDAPLIVSKGLVPTGNNAGELTMFLPASVNTFGYGYALFTDAPISNATSVSLFNGATGIGGLTYAGVPDPGSTGGFAGIQSTLPFNIVKVTFNSTDTTAFALDNIRTATVVPEPTSILLIGAGIGFLGICHILLKLAPSRT